MTIATDQVPAPAPRSTPPRAPAKLWIVLVAVIGLVVLLALTMRLAADREARPAPTQTTAAPSAPAPSAVVTGKPVTMPGASNTGVPSGTALTDYSGPMTIEQPGTVIDAKTIHGALLIAAEDVVIRRSHIIGDVSNEATGSSFTISDSTIEAGDRPVTGIGAMNFTATRVHVSGGNRSILCARNCTVEYSYVHGQMTDETGTFHESGIRMSQHSTIRFNTIACDAPDVPPDGGCSAALTGYGDFEPVQDNLVEGNLFKHGSGGFCAYGGSSGAQGSKPFGAKAARIRFVDNVWERGTSPGEKGDPVCGYWGPITDFDPSRPGNVWSGNTFDDGTPIKP